MFRRVLAASTLAFALATAQGHADELQTYRVSIKDHRFLPAELHVPAGKPFFLEIVNEEAQVDEFEMSAPPLEKLVQPGASGKVRVRPLANGRFPFFDDFHPPTTGAVVAE